VGEITELLDQVRRGDTAARERFFSAVYADLETLARQHLSRHSPLTLLDPPALVRESYLRIDRRGDLPGESRGEFFAYASKAMRCIVIDYIRARSSERNGGGQRRITLTSNVVRHTFTDPQLDLLREALDSLEQIDGRAHRVVEMRFFGGMELQEVAQQLDVSLATVKRDWIKARGFLMNAMLESP
jgi:RNA polymerase sigma factor (TIGR02999 family)